MVILIAAVGIACGNLAAPTAPSPSSVQVSIGFFSAGLCSSVTGSTCPHTPRQLARWCSVTDGSYGLENLYSNIVEITNAPVEEGYKQLPSFNGVHGFDPKPVLEAISVPGLWLLGGEDRSIPTPATVAILDQLMALGKPYAHVVFPGVGHNVPPSWPDIDQWLA